MGLADEEALATAAARRRERGSTLVDLAARYTFLIGRLHDHGFEDERRVAENIAHKCRELITAAGVFAIPLAENPGATGLLEARRRLLAAKSGLLEPVAEALSVESAELAEFSVRTEAAIRTSRYRVALAALFTLLLLIGSTYAILRMVVRPVNRLTRATAQVGAGEAVDLEVPRSRTSWATSSRVPPHGR